MNRLARVILLLAINAVPVVGVGWAGWANATALVLYWCETVILVALVALRIDLHRRWTNKRGHYCEVLVTTTWNGVTKSETRIGQFGTNFVTVALAFLFVHTIFLGFILAKTGLLQTVNFMQLKQGLTATTTFLCLGLSLDLVRLRNLPFAWVQDLSNGVLRRVLLVQVVIIFGAVAIWWFKLPTAILLTFVILKIFTDVTSQIPQYNPVEAPKWMVRLLGKGFAEYWRAERRADEDRARAEEEIFTGKPMPPGKAQ